MTSLLGGNTGGQGDMQFAAGGHVEAHPLLVGETGHGRAEEGLGGVDGVVPEGGHRLPAPGPQVFLVVDEEGRAELPGQVDGVAAPDGEVAAVADGGGVGEQLPGKRVAGRGVFVVRCWTQCHRIRSYMCSGALTPRRSSPMARPILVASASHSRACWRFGSRSERSTGQSR